MTKKITRREFLHRSAVGVTAFTIVPSAILGRSAGHTMPSDKLNIAGVGVGGKGAHNLRNMSSQNIVALCDVDWAYAGHVFEQYPGARRFRDYRRMLDEMGGSIDAVVIATADHTHAVIAADAITLGKHVYCQKPLTHSVYESRLLARLGRKWRVATQMGNEGASEEGVRQLCDWVWSGEIGEVRHVEAFTDRPIWPQGLMRPEETETVPDTLSWDLFIGPAPMRPYNSIYTPWNWRGWWDFGVGALGDMACHILSPVFKSLRLEYPETVQGSSTALLTESAPSAQHVRYTFPDRVSSGNLGLPGVTLDWYDGGLRPPRPEGMPDGKDLNSPGGGGGVIFHGSKDTLFCDSSGGNPWLMSGRRPVVAVIGRVVGTTHEMDWVRACKENPDNRTPCASDFDFAGPLNETVVMGVLAVRLQALNKILHWDGPCMEFTNIGPGETIRIMEQDGFSIRDGHPTFDKKYTEPLNAAQFAAELIKHTYHNGYSLPAMPE